MRTLGTTVRIATVLAFAGLVLGGGQLAADESPWYVVGRFGDASVDALLGSDPGSRQIDDSATAAAVDVGYTLNRHLAIELGYQDLGRHTGLGSPCTPIDDVCIQRLATLGLCVEGFDCTQVISTIEAEVDGVSLALVPSWPLAERLALRGKVGVIAWDTDVTVENGFVLADARRTTRNGDQFSGRDLLAGLGLHYTFRGEGFRNGLGVLLQHETFDLDARTTSLGVSWRF